MAQLIQGIYRAISMRRFEALSRANIQRVISVMTLPLDQDLYAKYEHLVVECDDLEEENLLQHFATTKNFIRRGVEENVGVLCHWWELQAPFEIRAHTQPPFSCTADQHQGFFSFSSSINPTLTYIC